MNTNLIPYAIGATNFAVGLSAPFVFTPPSHCNGVRIHKTATGGTLWINGLSSLIGTGDTIGDTENYTIEGPARFYLWSTGATSAVGIRMSFSAGSTLAGATNDIL